MNQRFIMFRRAGVFYCEDTTTGKQISLRTKDQAEARTVLHAKNESFRQPVLNLQIARGLPRRGPASRTPQSGPAGRDLDYCLHVNPTGKEWGMLLVFNPLDQEVTQTLDIPLYYAGLAETATVREQEGTAKTFKLDRQFNVKLPVTIPADGYTWLVIEP